MPRVLIAGQDPVLVDVLPGELRRAAVAAEVVRRGEDALARLAEPPRPAVLLADASLDDLTPTELCRRVAQDRRLRSVRVVVTSDRGSEVDRVVAFELGADDYVTKPFSMRELVLRLRAIARRGVRVAPGSSELLVAGPLRVDVPGHRVWVEGREVHLTVIELELLATLLRRRGRVETRARLLSDVWGGDASIRARTIDTHVRHLRGKLGPVGDYVETVRGVGYRFRGEDDTGAPSP